MWTYLFHELLGRWKQTLPFEQVGYLQFVHERRSSRKQNCLDCLMNGVDIYFLHLQEFFLLFDLFGYFGDRVAADLRVFRFFSYNFTSRKAMSVRKFLDNFIEFSFSSTVFLAVFSIV